MAKYRLRVPESGTWLYGDGPPSVVADDIWEARELFEEDEEGNFPIYLHSSIGVCRVLYKRDIEAGDGHEGAEPGDTTVEYCRDDGTPIDPTYQCRVWELGWPGVPWSMSTDPDAKLPRRYIQSGLRAEHPVFGEGETTSGVVDGHVSAKFGSILVTCHASSLSYFTTHAWPPRDAWPRRVLNIDGEVVAHGSDDTLSPIMGVRMARLRAEWEVEQFAIFERELAQRRIVSGTVEL